MLLQFLLTYNLHAFSFFFFFFICLAFLLFFHFNFIFSLIYLLFSLLEPFDKKAKKLQKAELCFFYFFVIKFCFIFLNPIQDAVFRGRSQRGRGAKRPPPSIESVTHILQWWNLPQLYLTQRRSKNYMDHMTHSLSSAEISSIFSPEISKFCFIKKYRYRLYFDT